jgi:hypothetical protein
MVQNECLSQCTSAGVSSCIPLWHGLTLGNNGFDPRGDLWDRFSPFETRELTNTELNEKYQCGEGWFGRILRTIESGKHALLLLTIQKNLSRIIRNSRVWKR